MTAKSKFGEEFKRLVIEKGLTLKELSERSGINSTTIYNIENCKCATVRYSTAYAVCVALQCEISNIFPG